ncbi:hypothetical protein ACWCOM_12315 [Kocuria sp. KH4]
MDDRVIARAQARMIRAAITGAGWSAYDLWWAYRRLGGGIGRWEVDAFLHHAMHLGAPDRDCLAQVTNQLVPGAGVPCTWAFPPLVE